MKTTPLSQLIPISGVYSIVNIVNGRAYIGQSRNIIARWSTHVECLIAGKHTNKGLQNDWIKYGANAFSASIVKQCEPEFLLKEESLVIKEYSKLAGVYNSGHDQPFFSQSRHFRRVAKRRKRKMRVSNG